MASSASCLTRVANSTPTEWDCTAICGALNEDGECSEVSGCIDMGNGMVKGGRPSWANSAGRIVLGRHLIMAAMFLVVGVWMLLWL